MLLILTAAVLWPYVITERNYCYMPYYNRFTPDYLSACYPYYYPAAEANKTFSLAVGAGGLMLLATHTVGREIQTDILRALALAPPAWLFHRYFCRHKINRHTSLHQVMRTNRLNEYRRWKAMVLWLFVAASPAICRTGGNDAWYLTALAFHLLAALTLGKDVFTRMNLMRPYHLLVLAVSATLFGWFFYGDCFTLAYWCIGMMLLKAFEYRVRFHDPSGGDYCEQWGYEDYTYRSPEERKELDALCRRQAEAWWQSKGRPCWRFIVNAPGSSMQTPSAIYYAADRELMRAELNRRKRTVLREDCYRNFDTAFRATLSDSRKDRTINVTSNYTNQPG